MSELQELNIEEELLKSKNEDVPVLSIQTDPLDEEEPQEEEQQEEPQEEEQQQELLSSLIQGSPSQSPSKEEGEILEPLEEGEIPESLEEGEILEPLEEGEILEPLEEGEILEPLEEGEILEPLEEGEILEPLEEGEILEDTVNLQNEQSMFQNEEQDSDEDSSDEEESIIYKNLEEDIDTNLLKFYHPETENINYKELLTLSKITKNKKGEIIDPFHKTLPFITQYEKAKILGQRAKQINHGSIPFVDISSNIIDGHTIALMELNQKKIPFIIRRPLPNGTSEYWKVKDLKIIM